VERMNKHDHNILVTRTTAEHCRQVEKVVPAAEFHEMARAIVVRKNDVIHGMEGALPSVVGGLVSVPVIAVPTSVGYGASFGGVAALLGMLNSCASNVTVVNIDNGFGAGFVASLINRKQPPPALSPE